MRPRRRLRGLGRATPPPRPKEPGVAGWGDQGPSFWAAYRRLGAYRAAGVGSSGWGPTAPGRDCSPGGPQDLSGALSVRRRTRRPREWRAYGPTDRRSRKPLKNLCCSWLSQPRWSSVDGHFSCTTRTGAMTSSHLTGT